MSKLDRQLAVIRMASELGISPDKDPVRGVVDYCTRKIQGWLRSCAQLPGDLAELEALICEKMHLMFEEVWSNEDLERVIGKYVAMKEFVFVKLRGDLDRETFATLMERSTATAVSPDRYVAVVDCRGEKASRRYFTRWHEIAHLLTLTRQLELPFHRSRKQRDPIEQLMDV